MSNLTGICGFNRFCNKKHGMYASLLLIHTWLPLLGGMFITHSLIFKISQPYLIAQPVYNVQVVLSAMSV